MPVKVLSHLLWVATKRLYDFSRLKLAAPYFSGKEIVRLYRRSQLILAAAYLSLKLAVTYRWNLTIPMYMIYVLFDMLRISMRYLSNFCQIPAAMRLI